MNQYWQTLKKLILNKWDKVSHEHLEQKRNNWSGIVDLLKEHYPHDDRIPKEFWSILQAHDESWYENHPTSPRTSETSELQDEIGNFQRTDETDAYQKRNEC